MKMLNASSLLNDMTALSKGKFKSYITVNDIKKEVYYLYTFEEDIEFETFYEICMKHINRLNIEDKEQCKSIIRELKFKYLGI